MNTYELTLNHDELVSVIAALRFKGTNRGKEMLIGRLPVGDSECTQIAKELVKLLDKS